MTDPTQKLDDDVMGLIRRHLESSTGRGRGRRSPLYRWMASNADAFGQMLTETQPTWESVAKGLAAAGLKDGYGNLPTAKRAQMTWASVQKDRAAKPIRQQPPPRQKSEPSSAAPARQKPAPAVTPSDDRASAANAAAVPKAIRDIQDMFAERGSGVPKPLLK
jgi:hypothetical protein